MIAQIFFYPEGYLNPIGFSAFTDRQGLYPAASPVISGTRGSFRSNYATFEKSSLGVDNATNIVGGFRAPANATVISPISHMVAFGVTQETLKLQLGLALTTDRDLLTFDPVKALSSADLNERADGERIVAAHIRLYALASILGRSTSPVRFLDYNFDDLARHLASYPRSSAFSAPAINALFDRGGITAPSSIRSAMVRIIELFLDLSPDRVAHRSDIARFRLAASGYLNPLVQEIYLDGTGAAATRANAITGTDMAFALERYGEALTNSADARFFPAPDFYQLPQGGSLTVAASYSCGCNGSNGPFTNNDAHFEGLPGDTFMGWRGTKTLTSVEVPSKHAAEISATLNSDGTVTMTALGSFVGLTYFDYVTRHEMGDVARGRVYVWVRR